MGRQATRLARAMVTRYGFSEVLGKVSLDYEDMGQTLSSETRAEVEHEACPPPPPAPLTHSHSPALLRPWQPPHSRVCTPIAGAKLCA